MEHEPANPQKADRCHVHDTLLQSGQVRVIYGLIRMEPPYRKARGEQFPLARSYVSGGCTVDFDRTHETVNYCPERRKAEKAWGASKAT